MSHSPITSRVNRRHLRAGLMVLLILCMGLCNGCKTEPAGPDPTTTGSLRTMAPAQIPQGVAIPIALHEPGVNPRAAENVDVSVVSMEQLELVRNTTMKRGRGAVLQQSASTGMKSYSVLSSMGSELARLSVEVVDLPQRRLSGTLTGHDLIWSSDSVIVVHDNLTVSAGSRLMVEAGTIVLVAGNARLTIQGDVQVLGTEEQPVVFAPLDSDQPWGEVFIQGGSALFDYVFFQGGGGDPSRVFGHSNSQPVLRAYDATVDVSNAVFVDNPGKAFATRESTVSISSSLITRCDTGGEFERSQVAVTDCWFTDMPDGDGRVDDDDNDGVYFNDPPPWRGVSSLERCVFVTGEDDAIDHNGANLRVAGCVIDGFYHEGVATSDKNTVEIVNTLIMNCEQGIEAGYGGPVVTVNHCTLINNAVGFRFGDDKGWEQHTGSITVINSIAVSNSRANVLVQVPAGEVSRADSVRISYSAVNNSAYDDGPGNLRLAPDFSADWVLQPGSTGSTSATDSSAIGLLPLDLP